MGDYRKLQVWERSHRLTLDIYQVTKALPKEELLGLTSQLRRAAASVPANIAEGCGRNNDSELSRFLVIAMGSATELDYHILLAHDLGYLSPADYNRIAAETQALTRMLATLIDRLRHPVKPSADVDQPLADS